MPLVATKPSPISLQRTVFEGFIQKAYRLAAKDLHWHSTPTLAFAYLFLHTDFGALILA
jgi:hypothetical protein